MRVLLLGANGQVGWQLRRSLSTIGEVIALDVDSTDYCGNLTRPQELARTVKAMEPSVVVNAAAYTAVDKAETDVQTAMAINATACEALADAARDIGAWLIHYSTDYVYDGSGERPWVETDATRPLSVYGRSKLAGDVAIMSGNPLHMIFRTCWVYDSWGQNFLKSILRAALTREQLTVVCDQWGAPTRAALIADVTAFALRAVLGSVEQQRLAGVYHLSASGETTWHRYASLVVREALARGLELRVRPENIRETTSSEYPSAAPRPRNSRLDTTKLRNAFGLRLPDWQDGVRSVVAELAHHSNLLKGLQGP